jgi:hypothetical protein
MEVNYWAILVCAVLSMVIGGLWYGPLFGKKWMEINGLSPEDRMKREAMQKSAGPLYAIQFALSLLQIYILAHFIKGWTDVSGVENAVWIWLGFVMPTVAGLSMWNMHPTRVRLAMFFISSGYQLVSFVLFGFILGTWQ